jgi:hypothetical protein
VFKNGTGHSYIGFILAFASSFHNKQQILSTGRRLADGAGEERVGSSGSNP